MVHFSLLDVDRLGSWSLCEDGAWHGRAEQHGMITVGPDGYTVHVTMMN